VQQLTHRNNSGSLAMFAAIRRFDLRQANLVDLDQAKPVQSMLTLFL
jgi:hypothetical protein